MKAKALAMMALALAPVAPLFGQGTISNVYAPLSTDFQDCATNKRSPMYYPALYSYPDGSLGMITQGNCLGACDPGMGDSLFRWKRSVNGSWKAGLGGLSPSQNTQTLNGQTIPAGALTWFKETVSEYPQSSDPCHTTTQLTSYTGTFGEPATIVLNNKVYMAFEKGNGDIWNGEIWWAVSSDWGRTWSVYPSPILYGLYHRGHDAGAVRCSENPMETICRCEGDPTKVCGCGEGFAGISMTTSTDAGVTWIHIYGGYTHPDRERRAWDAWTSAVHYRFRYDPNHPYGFSSTKQLYYNGGFINHSGKFVWGYDAGAPYASDIKLDPTLTHASWARPDIIGTASVTKDANGIYYMLVDGWRKPGDPLYYVTSCDAVSWSGLKTIDTTAIPSPQPGHPALVINNAIWYGTLSGQTGMWGFLSLGQYCSLDPYDGTRILPVKITFSAPQTCS